MGDEILWKGYLFVHSCIIIIPKDHMSPDESYLSPISRSGDIYRKEPTEVDDIALVPSRERDIPVEQYM